jgi:hypothetical protein
MNSCSYGTVLFWTPLFESGMLRDDATGDKLSFSLTGQRSAIPVESGSYAISFGMYKGPKWLESQKSLSTGEAKPIRLPSEGDRIVFDRMVFGKPENPVWDFA